MIQSSAMKQTFKWEARFYELSLLISSWSKDPGTKCGAVIVDKERRIISTGYNGFARGVNDDPDRLGDRSTKLRLTIHAEENAILFAPSSLRGCKMVVSAHPCAACAARIIQAGITEIAFGSNPEYELRWASDIVLAREQFREAGFYCHPVGRDTTTLERMMEG